MIDPKILDVTVDKVVNPRLPGGKAYFPFLFRRLPWIYKTATEAMERGQKVKARWIRLYEAAMAPTLPSPKYPHAAEYLGEEIGKGEKR